MFQDCINLKNVSIKTISSLVGKERLKFILRLKYILDTLRGTSESRVKYVVEYVYMLGSLY